MSQGSKTIHAIYIVCLAVSFFDFDLYNDLHDDIYDYNDFYAEEYCNKEYDFVNINKRAIAQLAGVSVNSCNVAIERLIKLK
jgi:hypothetical protein